MGQKFIYPDIYQVPLWMVVAHRLCKNKIIRPLGLGHQYRMGRGEGDSMEQSIPSTTLLWRKVGRSNKWKEKGLALYLPEYLVHIYLQSISFKSLITCPSFLLISVAVIMFCFNLECHSDGFASRWYIQNSITKLKCNFLNLIKNSQF